MTGKQDAHISPQGALVDTRNMQEDIATRMSALAAVDGELERAIYPTSPGDDIPTLLNKVEHWINAHVGPALEALGVLVTVPIATAGVDAEARLRWTVYGFMVNDKSIWKCEKGTQVAVLERVPMLIDAL